MFSSEDREAATRLAIHAAKNDLLAYLLLMNPHFNLAPHHRIICDELMALEEGTFDRLMIFISPRSSKSTISSIYFPSWCIGRNPQWEFLAISHSDDLSTRFGREVRDTIDTKKYQQIFPTIRIRKNDARAGEWSVTSRGDNAGRFLSAGIGSKLAGHGAHVALIDDPLALEINTPIPTPFGFTTIGALSVGNFVFGPDGKPTKVISKSHVWQDRELFKMTTDDNASIYCDGGHLWPYRADTKLSAPHKNMEAREFCSWNKSSKPCLPRHEPVEYPEQNLLIPPYILGAWLGDGTSSLGRMTAHPEDAPFMRKQFEDVGYTTTPQKDLYSFGVLKLREQLIKLNLLNNKMIPEEYLIASIPQRIALLQGLMDTDGCVSSEGQCTFSNTNKLLAEGVREILHSLGIKCKLHKRFDTRRRFNSRKPDYTVHFKYEHACRMPRKALRAYTPTDKRCRSFSVEKTPLRGDVQCITVEREDGLFLVGEEYVVTHNSEQEAFSVNERNRVNNLYPGGIRSRLMPQGRLVIIQTRWSEDDLSGFLLEQERINPLADKWRIIKIPALNDQKSLILLEEATHKLISQGYLPADYPLPLLGESFWPAPENFVEQKKFHWNTAALLRTKNNLPGYQWDAIYMQEPSSQEGGILKPDYWQDWKENMETPECIFTIHSWDTAFSTKTTADYSALTKWGVFKGPKDSYNLILLGAKKARYTYPELRDIAAEEYNKHKPDIILVEKKASGQSLIQDLRLSSLPVMEFNPDRDKVARAHSVAPLFVNERIFAPLRKKWAQEVIDECRKFPKATHDDYVDTVTQALIYFRNATFVSSTKHDWISELEDDILNTRKKRTYY